MMTASVLYKNTVFIQWPSDWLVSLTVPANNTAVLLNYISVPFTSILEPHAGAVSCKIGMMHFLAGWRKRRPEPGFSFVLGLILHILLFSLIVILVSCVVTRL